MRLQEYGMHMYDICDHRNNYELDPAQPQMHKIGIFDMIGLSLLHKTSSK